MGAVWLRCGRQVSRTRRAGEAGHASPACSKLGAMASATSPPSASGAWRGPRSHGDSIASAAALAVVPATSNSLAANFPISLLHLDRHHPQCRCPRRPRCPQQRLLLPTDHQVRLLAVSRAQASQHSWLRPPAAASSHSAYGQCTLAGAGPCPTTGPCHMAVDHRLFSEHCASSHLDRLVETVSSVCGTSRLALEIA